MRSNAWFTAGALGAILTTLVPFAAVVSADVRNARTGAGFASIQDAIDRARDGDTINVPPGRYEEVLSIRGKHVTLIGGDGKSESEQPVIASPPGQGAIWVQDVPRSDVLDVVIQNFTIAVSVPSGDAAVNVDGSPLSLIGNTVINRIEQGRPGTAVWTFAPHWIWLYGNEFKGFFKGVEVERAPVWIQYNTFQNAGDAVVLYSVDACLVEGNRFVNPRPPDTDDDPFENSIAMAVISSTRCIIRGNFVQYFHGGVFAVYNEQLQIECNELLDDRRGNGASVDVHGNPNPDVFLNDVAVWDNDWRRFAYGLVAENTHAFVVNNIDVSESRPRPPVTGMLNETRGRMDFPLIAHGNWWNDPTGPSQRGPGQGSGVSWFDNGPEVRFTPWLTSEPDLKAACEVDADKPATPAPTAKEAL